MTYNHNAMYFDTAVVINDTTAAANNNGGLVVVGGSSLHNTSVTGRIAVNTVDITPTSMISYMKINLFASLRKLSQLISPISIS